jgi:hypothetical protein
MIGLLFPRRNIVCSVHERADHDVNVITRAEELVFLREGFSLPVALLPPIGLAVRGAWLALGLYLVLAFAVLALLGAVGASGGLAAIVLVILGLIFAFEGPAIERWRMQRQGWNEIGVVSGADIEECERRFFDGWIEGETPKAALPVHSGHGVSTSPISQLRNLFSTRP